VFAQGTSRTPCFTPKRQDQADGPVRTGQGGRRWNPGARQFFWRRLPEGHTRRIATTTAIEDCTVTAIAKDVMVRMLHEEPKFSEMFMSYLLTRNSRIEADLIDQLFNRAKRRLARLLLLLADFGKEGGPRPISANISQETLAEMIGTTALSRQFLHEQIPQTGLHQLQRKNQGSQFVLSAVLHDNPQIKRDE